jgi:LacI family transcriptional regulator
MNVGIRRIAQVTGLSTATVSRALRDIPLVKAATKQKVEQAAAKLGYNSTPLLSALLSNVRKGQQDAYLGNLACVPISAEPNAKLNAFQTEMITGARERAATLGFSLQVVPYCTTRSTPAALQRILQHRGITGIIFINLHDTVDLSAFNWGPFASVQIDYPLSRPALSSVGIDHHRTLHAVLNQARADGFQRIGLYLEQQKDERINFRWRSAFMGYQHAIATVGRVPILVSSTPNRPAFLRWYQRYQPDFIIGHKGHALDWLEAQRIRVPQAVAYAALNVHEARRGCAGLDLVPRAQGATATEAVVALVHRFEFGLTQRPKVIQIAGEWRAGGTYAAPQKT